MAVKMGYPNVFAFRDGLPGWVMAGYATVTIEKVPKAKIPSVSTADLKKMLDSNDDFVLLDIRIQTVSKSYWINTPKRINIPLDVMIDRYKEIPQGKKVVIIGEIGKRSKIAGRYLKTKGYNDVASVDGGIQKWITDGNVVQYAD